MTKYPSIPTYHTLGDKGILLEETISFDSEVILTEKVDGTNSRIILLPDGTFVIVQLGRSNQPAMKGMNTGVNLE
jgi:ATP-dependent RNA circularization protein (DNA/RNA ligase family)